MTQIQAYESMSKEALIEHHKLTLQQHADDMDMLSKELTSRTFVVPDGWQIAPKRATDDMQEAALFVNGSIGDRYAAMLAAAPTSPVDPYRVLMADQAGLINIERLQHWLAKYGISSPESLEELGAKRGHYVNALTRQEPFAPAAPAALRYAAKVIELYDDATMRADYMLSSSDCAEILEALAEYFTVHPATSVDKTPEMQGLQVDGTDKMQGAGSPIPLREVKPARIPTRFPQKRACGNPQCGWQGFTDRLCGSVGPLCPECGETTEPICTCPSGDGSLRWPCPVHPPETDDLTKSSNQQVDSRIIIQSLSMAIKLIAKAAKSDGLQLASRTHNKINDALSLLERYELLGSPLRTSEGQS